MWHVLLTLGFKYIFFPFVYSYNQPSFNDMKLFSKDFASKIQQSGAGTIGNGSFTDWISLRET